MKYIVTFLLLLAFSCNTYAVSNNIEHVVWDTTPIKFSIPVGQERQINFPVPVTIRAPSNVVESSKPIQIREDGSVYWTALEEFETTRIQIITLTGYSYLLDVTAKKNAPSHPIVVLDDRVPNKESADSKPSKRYNYDYVDLVRMAAQNIYAPMRLTKLLPGVTQESTPNEEYPLYRGSSLITQPMAQWKSPTIPSFYVTAVRVTSNSLKEEIFDPRLIRGDFLTATPQHPVVHPVGEDGSTTTWYLVSAQPFIEAAQ